MSTGLIRLPHSFVELYSIVNKVKRRDLINADEYDDSSASEIAICLLTGAVMRSGSARRNHTRAVSNFWLLQMNPSLCRVSQRKHFLLLLSFFIRSLAQLDLVHCMREKWVQVLEFFSLFKNVRFC